MAALLENLGALLEEVAEREIMPRFQHLAAGDIISKASASDPDDLVTVADRAAEAFLTARLTALLPGSIVIGEEAVALEPGGLAALHGEAPVWLVDPIDGTKNFAAGSGPFGVMVALVERGEIVLSAIYLPLERELYRAERGAGAMRNGQTLRAREAGSVDLTGTLNTRFMPEAVLASLNAQPAGLSIADPRGCAAFEYARLARGDHDFALYFRLYPWDHAPGALILREAGGVARHADGKAYGPCGSEPMLLLAASEARWLSVRAALFGALAG